MKPSPPAFEVTSLTKVFVTGSVCVEALRSISLRAERGQFFAIMGPSGSGKSTLLHLIGGLDAPTSGQVRIGEADLGALDDDRRALFRRRQVNPTLGAMSRFQLNPVFLACCCVAAFVVPILAALYPAQRTARLQVIQALHYE